MKNLAAILVLILMSMSMNAQTFSSTISTFNRSKPSLIYLENGDSLSGKIVNIDRKKGVIIRIDLEIDNKKVKVEMDSIKYALLPENVLNAINNVTGNAMKIEENKNYFSRQELVKNGYGLFEKVDTKLKKNTHTVLLQLLNPLFCSKIKIYCDPNASETGGIGMMGMNVIGGDEKSYYVKIVGSNEPAFLLKKKDLDDNIAKLFSQCPKLFDSIKNDYLWGEFESYIFQNDNCN